MTDFKLNASGDTVIVNNHFEMTSSSDLLAQQIRQILSTNKGEWEFNEDEGIPFKEILIKSPDYAMIREYIRYALLQIDEDLKLTDISFNMDKNRVLHITFTANGEQAVLDFET